MLAALPTDSPDLFAWVFLPLFIFAARTFDMTLSTLRILSLSQGRRLLAPFIGFVEALIWLLVVGQALKYLSNPLCVVAYAGGFAAGNLVGLAVEERLAFGTRILRVILRDSAERTIEALRKADFGVTTVAGEGATGPVTVLFTLVRRRRLDAAIELVRTHSPRAFFSVEEVRQAAEGIFAAPPRRQRDPWYRRKFRWLRKSR